MDANYKAGRDAALEKVRKLLAVAQDARGNENEAANAARMAEAVMRKWQIESIDEVLAELNKDESFLRDMLDANPDIRPGQILQHSPKWVDSIAIGVGRAYEVKVGKVDNPEGLKMYFAGYEADVKTAGRVYKFLMMEVWRLSKQYGGDRASQMAFREGSSNVLQKKLYEIAAARKTEARQSGNGRELVLVDTKAKRVEEMFGKTETEQKPRSIRDAAAYAAGHAAGAKININTPLGGAGAQKRVTSM